MFRPLLNKDDPRTPPCPQITLFDVNENTINDVCLDDRGERVGAETNWSSRAAVITTKESVVQIPVVRM